MKTFRIVTDGNQLYKIQRRNLIFFWTMVDINGWDCSDDPDASFSDIEDARTFMKRLNPSVGGFLDPPKPKVNWIVVEYSK